MVVKGMKIFLAILIILGLSLGCSHNSSPSNEKDKNLLEENTGVEQVLFWNIGAEPKTIDPGLNASVDGGDVCNNMFEGLMREIDGKLEPAMAEGYTVSEDGLEYTFKLRDAKWSDGEKVTAYDFEWSWLRVLDKNTKSEYAKIFDEANIKSFAALDENTFKVVLKYPTPYFIDLMAFYTFFPVREESVSKGADGSWAINPEASIVNGPFMLEEYKSGDRIVLAKNPHYWRAEQVKLERIEALMIVEASKALSTYRADGLHVLKSPPTSEIPRLIAEDSTFYILPEDGVSYFVINISEPPLNDIRVRKALSLAIDRRALCESVAKGGQIPALNMISPNSYDAEGNLFSKRLGSFELDEIAQVELAQKLMIEAGYPNGENFPVIEFLYNTSETNKKIAEAVQEMWRQNLGVEIVLANQEWAAFQDTRRHGNFQIARAGWIGDYSDPMTYLGMFLKDSPMNYSGWNNPRYDELIALAKSKDGQERFELLYKAASLVEAQYVNIPIYNYSNTIMVKENVLGWQVSSRSKWFFGFVEIIQ